MNHREKEDKYNFDDHLSILKTAISSIARSRKRTTDTKQFVPLLSLFKILEPLKSKPTPNIRSFCKDVVKHFVQAGEIIATNTLQKSLEETWLIVEGKVIFTDDDPENGSCKILSAGDCFSKPSCIFKEYLNQPEESFQFTIKAKTCCILFSIENIKMNKLFEFDQVQEELQKRTLICRSLNLHTSGNTIKSFIKKFLLRKVQKATLLIQEDCREDSLIVVAKGDLELTKICVNFNKEKVRMRVGIVSEGDFINDYLFFKQAEVGMGRYTVEAMTEAEVYILPKAELFKYLYDLPTLWPSVASICEDKQKLRQQLITKNLQSRFPSSVQQSHSQTLSSLFRKSSRGVRKSTVPHNDDFIMESIKYEQLVLSKEKIAKPLLLKEFKTASKKISHIHSGELKKIIKKEKMDIMKVRNLVDNRIRGIRSDDVHIELKPTLFNDRLKYEEIIDHMVSFVVTSPLKLSPSKKKRRVDNLSSRDHKGQENTDPGYQNMRAMSAKIGRRPRNFKMVAPPRQHYQSQINKSTDPYVFVRCQTGKPRKVRAIF